MAKVQLNAFTGKLRSDYIDWPDSKIGEDIRLMLDISMRGKYMGYTKAMEYTTRTVIGIFEYTGQAGPYIHPDGTTELVHIYNLVSIN